MLPVGNAVLLARIRLTMSASDVPVDTFRHSRMFCEHGGELVGICITHMQVEVAHLRGM